MLRVVCLFVALTACSAEGRLALEPSVGRIQRLRGGGSYDVKLKGVWSTVPSAQSEQEVDVKMMKVDHIREWIDGLHKYDNPILHKGQFVGEDEAVVDVVYVNSQRAKEKKIKCRQWVRAGPREKIYFNPKEVVAAIVTCGGLCPGLNNVIQSVTEALLSNYGAKKVYGIQFGYTGFYKHEWLDLTMERVAQIHKRGGTILGSSRGGFDLDKIFAKLKEHHVNQVYVVGGDGTHKGGNLISREAAKRGLPLTVCGVPKTIDNDVAFIDRSFGFNTAVAEAVRVIQCGLIEADDAHEGVGIVKLMGREAGFIAMYATLASNDVDICLIPEDHFEVDELFRYAREVIGRKGHCVIAVAEGAGERHFANMELGTDASGNKKLPDIGTWLRDEAKKWLKEHGYPSDVKYIDPSYQVRSIPAAASDAVYCQSLGQAVTHGAMFGLTGFSCGLRNNRYVYIPIDDMCAPEHVVRVDTNSRVYNRMLRHTGQPQFRKD